ncbi:transposase [Ornithinimicrobium sp. LYQ121]|uniref:transposase n=1 Tax=Ornithinimicrobium sp. LYQ121 TaxID=3378801 RepID=UPI0038548C83
MAAQLGSGLGDHGGATFRSGPSLGVRQSRSGAGDNASEVGWCDADRSGGRSDRALSRAADRGGYCPDPPAGSCAVDRGSRTRGHRRSREESEPDVEELPVCRVVVSATLVHPGDRPAARSGLGFHPPGGAGVRTVRYLRDPDTHAVSRVEPWSIVFSDLDTGAILDVVDGRRGQVVTAWLAARPRWWRSACAAGRPRHEQRVPRSRPQGAARGPRISVDHWHVVRLANEMVTKMRRRRVWELHERCGLAVDTHWNDRKLLTCAGDRLSVRQRERLQQILAEDIELAVAWGIIKEHVRQVLAARTCPRSSATGPGSRAPCGQPAWPNRSRCSGRCVAWRRELLTCCRTRVTNARTKRTALPTHPPRTRGAAYSGAATPNHAWGHCTAARSGWRTDLSSRRIPFAGDL